MSANSLTVKQSIDLVGQPSPPVSPVNGNIYYDSTLNVFQFYQNGAYINISSNATMPEYNAGNSGTALTVNFNNGPAQKVTLTGNCTFTFSNPVNGSTYLLKLVQDATGSRTVTWPASVKWAGSAPVLSTAAAKIDLISFYYDGTNHFGTYSIGY